MRIGDAISSSANRRTVPERYQKTYAYTNYKTHRKSENHGNIQRTDQICYSNKGQILAQRILSDGSIQFLFKEDMTPQPKWETKAKMATEYQQILEKYEKQQSLVMQNISDLRKEQDFSMNGKRRYEKDGEQDMNQLDSQQGRKKQFIEERESQDDNEDQDSRGLNHNAADSKEEDKKETKKIDLKELFRDIQDDDSSSEEQKKEEFYERIDNCQKEDQIVQDNCHQMNENNSENNNQFGVLNPRKGEIRSSEEINKPEMENIIKIASKKIQETTRKRTEEKNNRLDILDEFRFVDTESQEEIDIESDEDSEEVQKQKKEMEYPEQQRIKDKDKSGRENKHDSGEQKIKQQIVEEQKNNQEEGGDSSQYLNKLQEKEKQQTKLTSIQSTSLKQQQQLNNLPQNGDFSFGDKVKRIRSCQRKEGNLIMEVEWLPRFDGSIPKKSTVPSSVIREYDAITLLDFYESKLSFPAKNKNNQKEH